MICLFRHYCCWRSHKAIGSLVYTTFLKTSEKISKFVWKLWLKVPSSVVVVVVFFFFCWSAFYYYYYYYFWFEEKLPFDLYILGHFQFGSYFFLTLKLIWLMLFLTCYQVSSYHQVTTKNAYVWWHFWAHKQGAQH